MPGRTFCLLVSKSVLVDCSVKRLCRSTPSNNGNDGSKWRSNDDAQWCHLLPEQSQRESKHTRSKSNTDKGDDPGNGDTDVVEHNGKRTHSNSKYSNAQVRDSNKLFSGGIWVQVSSVDVVSNNGGESDQLGTGGRSGRKPHHQHPCSCSRLTQNLVQTVQHRDTLVDELCWDWVWVSWRRWIVHKSKRRHGRARRQCKWDNQPTQSAKEVSPHTAPWRGSKGLLTVTWVGEDGSKATHNDVPTVEKSGFVIPGQVAALETGRRVSNQNNDINDHSVDPVRQEGRLETTGHSICPDTNRKQHGSGHNVHSSDSTDSLASTKQQHSRNNHVCAHSVEKTHPVGHRPKSGANDLEHSVCSRSLTLDFKRNNGEKSNLDGECKCIPRTRDPILIGHARTSKYGASAMSNSTRRPRRPNRS
ncbi:hypothetical protein OGAPHI_005954 [Ogataea philodendri]|uniref:Uncharacterized protein n=1 Tax=Ogataea philodendri TaxID=1378263 RepID=A0A9P8T1K4_9ASCO|nr:uncharacterized protein OGAPHI_005954 [Ogataea philodendri]KAH3661776.1 hypothetical protein OGAPHI_005954 [Ogataea philodendri]